MGDFSVAVEHVDGTVLLRPSGELDLATAPELQRALDGVVGKHWAVVLDLSGGHFR
jgi:anti-anti-sigma regulatory factor